MNRTEDAPVDMVLVELIPESLDGTGKTPVDAGRLSTSHELPPPHERLFLQGFPELFSEPRGINELHSTTVPLSLPQVEETRRLTATSIYVDYHQTAAHDANGNTRVMPDPPGLSGSSLWRPMWNEENPTWSPELAQIVGLVKHWYEDEDMLEAVPVHDLLVLLEDALAKPSP